MNDLRIDFKHWVVGGHEPSNTYKFRGEINFEHLTNDCIKDGKIGFVAICEKVAYVGMIDEINWLLIPDLPMMSYETTHGFRIYKIDKNKIWEAINYMERIAKEYHKNAAKIARKIKKQNNSNKPETKVITF